MNSKRPPASLVCRSVLHCHTVAQITTNQASLDQQHGELPPETVLQCSKILARHEILHQGRLQSLHQSSYIYTNQTLHLPHTVSRAHSPFNKSYCFFNIDNSTMKGSQYDKAVEPAIRKSGIDLAPLISYEGTIRLLQRCNVLRNLCYVYSVQLIA
jgi:hypothetical protein